MSLSYRMVVVSDVHLGTPAARVEYLLDFLDHVSTETLVLNGDLFDIWKMRGHRWAWPLSKTRLLQRVMAMAAAGTRVVYIPGNHDEFFRDYIGVSVGGVEVRRQWRCTLADGRRALLLHGDEFDGMVRHSRLLKGLGSVGYEFLMGLDRFNAWWRRCIGRGYWSLARAVKGQVPGARSYIQKFEAAACLHAREQAADVIICGHIHHASLFTRDGITYANSGDWVEHCTALVERHDGQLELIRWAEESARLLDAAGAGEAPAAGGGIRRRAVP
ncbi:MAG: UDP-2,3-diacylglucosamine diphosphatase [Guyparkeria sp.]|uniref:UDP-2,3-diacylglucosamine diphosphatase n=1 Tax=Guyparkeria sp. TaxID=2035736 RepID=UPI00397840FA